MPLIDFSRLKAQLLTSGLQQKDNPLFQVINQLIGFIEKLQGTFSTDISSTGSAASNLATHSFITINDDSAALPNSRQLLAGTNITFDDSIANERTINSSGGGSGGYEPLTDGDEFETTLIFANGECVMVEMNP